MKGTAYLLQATLVSLWWIGLLINNSFYNAFQFPNINKIAFNSFLIPDITIIAILSVYRAYSNKKEIEYIILGGFAFATLYCINASILSNGGYLSTTLMILGLSYNLFLTFEHKLFHNSKTDKIFLNGLKTVIQIICIWTISLILFPLLILHSFNIDPYINNSNKIIGMVLLIIFSLLGLYSAYVMVKKGKGTPLPLDQTKKLVVNGPYKFVRNPMAIAGIGQSISISIILNSFHLLIYSLLGAILWQFVVRPIEEKDMRNRFGVEYETYIKKVRCWIPKFK